MIQNVKISICMNALKRIEIPSTCAHLSTRIRVNNKKKMSSEQKFARARSVGIKYTREPAIIINARSQNPLRRICVYIHIRPNESSTSINIT